MLRTQRPADEPNSTRAKNEAVRPWNRDQRGSQVHRRGDIGSPRVRWTDQPLQITEQRRIGRSRWLASAARRSPPDTALRRDGRMRAGHRQIAQFLLDSGACQSVGLGYGVNASAAQNLRASGPPKAVLFARQEGA
jgi:hypothetical protein